MKKPEDLKDEFEMHNITILDARKHTPGSPKDTGFTLITLNEVVFSHESNSRIANVC